jgi:hypothetical protein
MSINEKTGGQRVKNVITFTALISTLLFAQNDRDTSESKYAAITKQRYSNYIGFAGGFTAGSGISFRKWIKNKNGFQINILPIYTENKYPPAEIYPVIDSGFQNSGSLSCGLIYLRNLADAKYFRFLAYAGGNVLANYDKYDYYTKTGAWSSTRDAYIDSVEHKVGDTRKYEISLGGGCGFEFYVWRFAFHAMLGLRGQYEIVNQSKGITPTGEGGVHFRF